MISPQHNADFRWIRWLSFAVATVRRTGYPKTVRMIDATQIEFIASMYLSCTRENTHTQPGDGGGPDLCGCDRNINEMRSSGCHWYLPE